MKMNEEGNLSSSASASYSSLSESTPLTAEGSQSYHSTSLSKRNKGKKTHKRILFEKLHINNIAKKPYKVVLPKLIRSDIRKQYPIMLTRVMNEPEAFSLADFMNIFTERNCVFEHVYYDKRKEIQNETLRFDSIDPLVRFYALAKVMVPDRYYTIKAASVITRSDTFSSQIIVDWTLRGTKLYNLRPVALAGCDASNVSNEESSDPIASQGLLSSSELVSFSPHRNSNVDTSITLSAQPALPRQSYCTPHQLLVEGRWVMIVEDPRQHCKISKIYSHNTYSYPK